MKIWVTCYALTKGVYELDVEDCNDGSGMVESTTKGWTRYFHRPAYELTERSAREKVIDKIEAKRASIKKQLAKLDKLEASTKARLEALR